MKNVKFEFYLLYEFFSLKFLNLYFLLRVVWEKILVEIMVSDNIRLSFIINFIVFVFNLWDKNRCLNLKS